MTHRFHHEQIYRGKEAMAKLAEVSVHICGAGAIGSNLSVNLARTGIGSISVIDKDRVEERNVGTQVYSIEDVGGCKADVLRNLIYREVGTEISSVHEELSERNIGKLLRGATLVVDTFDNSESRRLVTEHCRTHLVDCLHAGINADYGALTWNEMYLVPQEGGLDLCDYPLARNLILLVVAIASEALIRFILTGHKENYSVTVQDLIINREVDL